MVSRRETPEDAADPAASSSMRADAADPAASSMRQDAADPAASSSMRGTFAETVRPTFAAVDLGALRHNLGVVQALVGKAVRVLAVVKADGYGHGAIESARTFVDAGAWGLGVSLVEEGIELRDAGVTAPVVVLGGVHPGSPQMLVKHRLHPVVWDREHLGMLAAAVRDAGGKALPVHLKIDTGMSRLGVLPNQLDPVLEWFVADAGRTLDLEGVMTHLASADDLHDPDDCNGRQLRAFTQCLERIAERGLQPRLRHVCNSAAMARFPAAHYDMVRPGIALYGAGACEEVELDGLRPAMSVRSRVLGIRSLPAGAKISYGGLHTLTRPSRLAIVPVGYGDGYARSMSGKASMLIRGTRCAVLGAITMDVCMVDVTDLPDVQAGEAVVLLGAQRDAQIRAYDVGGWAGTIPYEVTCGISKRVPRQFFDRG